MVEMITVVVKLRGVLFADTKELLEKVAQNYKQLFAHFWKKWNNRIFAPHNNIYNI
jgi:uncharacterized membrane-anchored protein YhcB (DUF1043 family)